MGSVWVVVLAVSTAWTRALAPSPSTIPTIDNPAKAPRTQVVRLEEQWRIGEDDDANAVVFGQVGSLAVDSDGRVYVVDAQARQINVFSADGDFLRTLGRQGEGPGEFREPRGLVLMPDGAIGVVREEPPAILRFRASDGSFLGDFYFTEDFNHPFQRISAVKCRGGTLLAMCSDVREAPDGVDVTARLLRFDKAGKFLGECDSIDAQIRFAESVTRERYDLMWQVGPDDRVFVNRGLEYGFDVRGPDCRAERTIARKYERLKRTSAELDSVRTYYQRVGNIGGRRLDLFDHVRDVAWFSIDDAGCLWVLSSRGRVDLPADSLGFFDVYDAQGRLDRTVDLKAERGARDWFHMDGDRFFVVHRETMAVVAYRMPGLGR